MQTLPGGQKYFIGKNVAEAHKGLGISNADFDKALINLTISLVEMRPKPELLNEILQKVESMRSIIVEQVETSEEQQIQIFDALGQEAGIREIFEIVFQLVEEKKLDPI